MRTLLWVLTPLMVLAARADGLAGQDTADRREARQVMDDFVRGWHEGVTALLSRVLALDEGRITWVSGSGSEATVRSMTFRQAVERNRVHPDYGRDGWELEYLDIVSDELAVAQLRISGR